MQTYKLNFKRPVTSKDIDMQAYAEKFYKAEKLLESNKPSIAEYALLLRDPTTFAYLCFRLDGKRLKLYAYQDLILNDPHRFIYFRASNQIGKSMSLDVKAASNLDRDWET